ncbi:uncharacterized protein HKW66_Vig0087080 [Vigna angularis]|uniref:Uncharacterized protein n=1 Tax=Phaseolus angularis TaxID=3914 RepID=A0A8T0KH67_PHAAN|nr:uncharacterized protein HKW66_Vig0087080 [Vigna angularis]
MVSRAGFTMQLTFFGECAPGFTVEVVVGACTWLSEYARWRSDLCESQLATYAWRKCYAIYIFALVVHTMYLMDMGCCIHGSQVFSNLCAEDMRCG